MGRIMRMLMLAGTVLATACFVPAQESVQPAARLSLPLETSGAAARAKSMGSAFVAVADDSSALFWNPAGLGGLQDPELGLHHNVWVADATQETAVFALPLGALGGLGASLNVVNYGTAEGRDSAGAPAADYTARDVGGSIGWGQEWTPGLFAGAALKGVRQTVADMTTQSFATDLGVLWAPWEPVRLGAAWVNLGPDTGGYPLASGIRAGASWQNKFEGDSRVILSGGVQIEPKGVHRGQVGAEEVLNAFLAVRAGYQWELNSTALRDGRGLCGGIGLMLRPLTLDYAYLPMGDLGATQRLSVTYQFVSGSLGQE